MKNSLISFRSKASFCNIITKTLLSAAKAKLRGMRGLCGGGGKRGGGIPQKYTHELGGVVVLQTTPQSRDARLGRTAILVALRPSFLPSCTWLSCRPFLRISPPRRSITSLFSLAPCVFFKLTSKYYQSCVPVKKIRPTGDLLLEGSPFVYVSNFVVLNSRYSSLRVGLLNLKYSLQHISS